MSVTSECCVLSDRGLCDGPIRRPEKSCRVYVCVIECDHVHKTITFCTYNE